MLHATSSAAAAVAMGLTRRTWMTLTRAAPCAAAASRSSSVRVFSSASSSSRFTVCPHLAHDPVYGERVLVCPSAEVMGNVRIGDDSAVWYQSVLRADVNRIEIGARTNVQDATIIHVNSHTPVIVGDDVTIGHGAIVHACTIGDRCLIGMGCTIMDEVQIGAESIVAAGALVTKGKSYPPRSLLVGNPAKRIGDVTDEQVEMIRQSALKYVRVKEEHEQRFGFAPAAGAAAARKRS